MNFINYFKEKKIDAKKVLFIEKVIENPNNNGESLVSVALWVKDLYRKKFLTHNEFSTIYKKHYEIIDKMA